MCVQYNAVRLLTFIRILLYVSTLPEHRSGPACNLNSSILTKPADNQTLNETRQLQPHKYRKTDKLTTGCVADRLSS